MQALWISDNRNREMSKTVEEIDRHFVVASGNNINFEPGNARFDGPPTDTFDLRITSLSDDPDPFLFEPGETYSLSWSTASGTVTIAEARVLRSDLAMAEDSGLVVFEGVDQAGTTYQLLWAPNLDLQSWYEINQAEGNGSGFRSADQDAANSYRYICFAAGTVIMTDGGLKDVAGLRIGNKVLTLDHGFQPLIWIGRRTVPGTGPNTPVLCQPGSMGNRQPLTVSPQHRLLWASGRSDLMYGAPQVLMPAKALINGDTIRYAPRPWVRYVHLMLERHEILNAADGAACESLLAGDMAQQVIDAPFAHGCAGIAARPVLSYREARHLVLADAGQTARIWWPASGSDRNGGGGKDTAQGKAALHLRHARQA